MEFNNAPNYNLGLFNLLGRPSLLGAYPASNVKTKFDEFILKLQLSQTQINAAYINAQNVATVLHNKYSPLYPSMVASSYKIIGSYLKKTAISPPTDIDMLFIMPSTSFSRINAVAGNSQSYLLQEVRQALLNRYPSTNIKADGQIVLVPFGTYSVEVVPCYLVQNGEYYIPDTNDGGKWKTTHLSYEQNLINSSNIRSKGNTLNLIKMLKAWKENCNVEIKSVVLEVMSTHFLAKWINFDKDAYYYDFMIRDFMKEFLIYAGGNWTLPSGEKIEFGDQWKSKAESALARAEKGSAYFLDGKNDLACEEFKKIFGYRFPS